MKKRIILLAVFLLLLVVLAGCNAQVNNPVDGIMAGLQRSLSGIGNSISGMFDNMAKGIRFGP